MSLMDMDFTREKPMAKQKPKTDAERIAELQRAFDKQVGENQNLDKRNRILEAEVAGAEEACEYHRDLHEQSKRTISEQGIAIADQGKEISELKRKHKTMTDSYSRESQAHAVTRTKLVSRGGELAVLAKEKKNLQSELTSAGNEIAALEKSNNFLARCVYGLSITIGCALAAVQAYNLGWF